MIFWHELQHLGGR